MSRKKGKKRQEEVREFRQGLFKSVFGFFQRTRQAEGRNPTLTETLDHLGGPEKVTGELARQTHEQAMRATRAIESRGGSPESKG